MIGASSGDYVARVQRVMDFVRADPARDLSLETLAAVAYFSPFHFHRIFKTVTGETVAQFARRARLERAAFLMQASPDRTLTSIAADLGFASQSELSRAFRRAYGIAPKAWDRRSRLDSAAAGSRCEPEPTPSAEPRRATRIVERPACRLAYVRMRTYFVGEALPEGFARLTEWLERRDVDWRREAMVGMSWDHHRVTSLEQVHYDFGFTIPDHVVGEADIGVHQLPAVRAVEVRCRGPLQEIAEAWDYLYDDWFPRSRYEPDDLPPMKRFRQRPDEIGWSEWDLDCSIAIRPARA